MSRPRTRTSKARRWIEACLLLAGVIGYLLARNRVVFLVGPLATAVPAEKHVPFLVDLWTHNASYLVGFVGGIILVFLTWRRRLIPLRGETAE